MGCWPSLRPILFIYKDLLEWNNIQWMIYNEDQKLNDLNSADYIMILLKADDC